MKIHTTPQISRAYYFMVNYLAGICPSIFSTRGKFCQDRHPRKLHALPHALLQICITNFFYKFLSDLYSY